MLDLFALLQKLKNPTTKCNSQKGDYMQNRCLMSDKSCRPCPARLTSCVGLPNGKNPMVGFMWKSKYIICYKNRTLRSEECPVGEYFHPRRGVCLKPVEPVDVPDYCKAHLSDILPNPYNCGQYFNCSTGITSTLQSQTPRSLELFKMECSYPDLFDSSSSKCGHFEIVACRGRPEPQAPCQYEQNLCQASNTSCQMCSNRLPNCIGNIDGDHEFPDKLWQRDYIICYKNRTISTTSCENGSYFNPRTKKCQTTVEK
ncbi:uncharacterized protein LOC134230562, partial [Saccostrea cucullata]|uniref:uncharacterized protein LOC134230562 n=1 Tax=Saccostrea cuccullata TaxID=36930 RepID=UPI002ED3A023